MASLPVSTTLPESPKAILTGTVADIQARSGLTLYLLTADGQQIRLGVTDSQGGFRVAVASDWRFPALLYIPRQERAFLSALVPIAPKVGEGLHVNLNWVTDSMAQAWWGSDAPEILTQIAHDKLSRASARLLASQLKALDASQYHLLARSFAALVLGEALPFEEYTNRPYQALPNQPLGLPAAVLQTLQFQFPQIPVPQLLQEAQTPHSPLFEPRWLERLEEWPLISAELLASGASLTQAFAILQSSLSAQDAGELALSRSVEALKALETFNQSVPESLTLSERRLLLQSQGKALSFAWKPHAQAHLTAVQLEQSAQQLTRLTGPVLWNIWEQNRDTMSAESLALFLPSLGQALGHWAVQQGWDLAGTSIPAHAPSMMERLGQTLAPPLANALRQEGQTLTEAQRSLWFSVLTENLTEVLAAFPQDWAETPLETTPILARNATAALSQALTPVVQAARLPNWPLLVQESALRWLSFALQRELLSQNLRTPTLSGSLVNTMQNLAGLSVMSIASLMPLLQGLEVEAQSALTAATLESVLEGTKNQNLKGNLPTELLQRTTHLVQILAPALTKAVLENSLRRGLVLESLARAAAAGILREAEREKLVWTQPFTAASTLQSQSVIWATRESMIAEQALQRWEQQSGKPAALAGALAVLPGPLLNDWLAQVADLSLTSPLQLFRPALWEGLFQASAQVGQILWRQGVTLEETRVTSLQVFTLASDPMLASPQALDLNLAILPRALGIAQAASMPFRDQTNLVQNLAILVQASPQTNAPLQQAITLIEKQAQTPVNLTLWNLAGTTLSPLTLESNTLALQARLTAVQPRLVTLISTYTQQAQQALAQGQTLNAFAPPVSTTTIPPSTTPAGSAARPPLTLGTLSSFGFSTWVDTTIPPTTRPQTTQPLSTVLVTKLTSSTSSTLQPTTTQIAPTSSTTTTQIAPTSSTTTTQIASTSSTTTTTTFRNSTTTGPSSSASSSSLVPSSTSSTTTTTLPQLGKISQLKIGGQDLLAGSIVLEQGLIQPALQYAGNSLTPIIQLSFSDLHNLDSASLSVTVKNLLSGSEIASTLQGVTIRQEAFTVAQGATFSLHNASGWLLNVRANTNALSDVFTLSNQQLTLDTQGLLQRFQFATSSPISLQSGIPYLLTVRAPQLEVQNAAGQTFRQAQGCFFVAGSASPPGGAQQRCSDILGVTSTTSTTSPTTTLPPPRYFNALAFNQGVHLSWSSTAQPTSYTVYQAQTPGINPQNSASFQQTYTGLATTTLTLLTNNLTLCGESALWQNHIPYYFLVTARHGTSESLPSVEVAVTPRTLQPRFWASQLDLDYETPLQEDRFTLSWNPFQGATKYRLAATVYLANTNALGLPNLASFTYNRLEFQPGNTSQSLVAEGKTWRSAYVKAGTRWQISLMALDSTNAILATTSLSLIVGQPRLMAPAALWGESQNTLALWQWCPVIASSGYALSYATSSSLATTFVAATTTRFALSATNGQSYSLRISTSGASLSPWTLGVTVTASSAQTFDLSLGSVTLNQAVEVDLTVGNTANVPWIAGKPSILRVFPRVTGAVQGRAVQVKLSAQRPGASLSPLIQEAVLRDVTHAQTNNALNFPVVFDLPAEWLLPQTSFWVEIDPNNQLAENNEANNRFPASGIQAFNFVERPPLQIKLVAINTTRGGSTLLTEALTNELRQYLRTIFPNFHLNVEAHPTALNLTVPNGNSGWQTALDALNTMRHAEISPAERHVFYYGLVRNVTDQEFANYSGLIGLGMTNLSASGSPPLVALGVAFPEYIKETLAHELAHNQGRRHVDTTGESNDSCGAAGNPDSSYPYRFGRIQRTGYNALTRELLSGEIYHDLMSYCDRLWISDYTYRGIYDFQTQLNAAQALIAQARLTPTPGILLSGLLEGQEWKLTAMIYTERLEEAVSSEYWLKWRTISGWEQQAPIRLTPLDHLSGQAFQVFLPMTEPLESAEIWEQTSGQRVWSAQAPPHQARWQGEFIQSLSPTEWQISALLSEQRLIRISHDSGQSWQVLTLDQDREPFVLRAQAGDWLEVQYRQGLALQRILKRLE